MHILQSAQKDLKDLGIIFHQSIQKHSFNRKNMLAILILGLSAILCVIYLYRIANTFIEYTYSVYAFSSMLVTATILAILIWKSPQYSVCLNKMETVINDRKLFNQMHGIVYSINS